MVRTSTEYSARVYDDDRGFYVQISPDADSLGLCRLAYVEPGDKPREFTISWAMAEAMADAIKDMRPLNIQEQA